MANGTICPEALRVAEVPVLYVDLDNTLIATDLLYEATIRAVRHNPSVIARLSRWLVTGKATLKANLAARVEIDAAHLPYREDVVAFLRAQKKAGVSVVLATASPQPWAESIAKHLDLFDEVLASDGEVNLKGPEKLQAIEDHACRSGWPAWGYIGDDRSDLCIWKMASARYVVPRKRSVLTGLRAIATPTREFRPADPWFAGVLRVIRPHQWAKNLLVLVPMIAAHRILDWPVLLMSLIAFACFCLCASSIYIVNDLLDLDADRCHPRKRHRPFASGHLPVHHGPFLAVLLFSLGMALSFLVNDWLFRAILLSYVATSLLYSYLLKRKAIVDVLSLAILYVIRILAGGAATGIPISAWLMAFSLLLFTSLAFAKRYAELRRLGDENRQTAVGRGYRVTDLPLLANIGISTGCSAVLVLALYIHSPETILMYRWPQLLWLTCPLLLFWIARVWLLATRGELNEDPVVFAIMDRISLAAAGIVGVILMIGIWPL